MINSLGGSLAAADPEAKDIMASFFYKADPEYGTGVAKVANADLAKVKDLASKLED